MASARSTVDFLRRLVPLIPPPYANLIRHYGLLAPNAKHRDRLPPAPVSWTGAVRPESLLAAQKAATASTVWVHTVRKDTEDESSRL